MPDCRVLVPLPRVKLFKSDGQTYPENSKRAKNSCMVFGLYTCVIIEFSRAKSRYAVEKTKTHEKTSWLNNKVGFSSKVNEEWRLGGDARCRMTKVSSDPNIP